ncbi:MAG: ATP-binding protein [bacterium]|nr:ATP-binding protein [bacterium]
MRRFSSYGPVDTEVHYYAPRQELIDTAYSQLVGDNPAKGGHFITIWAPRQTGKSWIMLQVLDRIEKNYRIRKDTNMPIDVVKVDLDLPEHDTDLNSITAKIAEDIFIELGKKNPGIDTLKQFPRLFTRDALDNPLILIIDEFDALPKDAISRLTRVFRNIYMSRQKELKKPVNERRYLLHGLALIGIRGVLGIESDKGSPFNIQRSLHIPNLSYDEVKKMFQWYEKESGQKVEEDVITKLFTDTNGQPGLTCWFGELLTETYNKNKAGPIAEEEWKYAYMYASGGLPNNNILNIIEKTQKEPYKTKALELFQTDEKIEFRFDDKVLNFLYMNGVIDIDENREDMKLYARFACPFIQKRLFHNFSNEIFHQLGRLTDPFDDMADAITEDSLNIPNIIKRYDKYLRKNREWLFKEAPRRKDLRLFEAVYHFNLFRYLYDLLKTWKSGVFPEFPTGNGKIDIMIKHGGKLYGLELKSFTTEKAYKEALHQAAVYGRQLGLEEISAIFFVDYIDEENRKKFESEYVEGETTVRPIFIQIFR